MSKTAITAIATGLVLAITPMVASAKDGKQQRPSFEQIDANADGAITADELANLRLVRFASADANGDGALDVEELSARGGERAANRAAQMLERLDANGDSLLTIEEMPDGADRTTRFFERMDANEDGSITQAEFEDAPKRGPRRSGSRGNQANN